MDMTDRWADKQKKKLKQNENHRGANALPPPCPHPVAPRLYITILPYWTIMAEW